MDGVGKSMDGILLLAATNVPWGLDPAVRRRFERKIYIPLPDTDARMALIRLKTRGMDSDLSENDMVELCRQTEGFSGADINILCRDAAMTPLNDIQSAQYFADYNGQLWPVNPGYAGAIKTTVLEMSAEQMARLVPPRLCFDHFTRALQKTRPSVAPGDLKRFEDWTAQFGQEGS
jgi:vacuolar protein-sorting-associated protein 4